MGGHRPVSFQCLSRGRSWKLLLCTVLLSAFSSSGGDYVEDTDRFPGWKGELPRPVHAGDEVAFSIPGQPQWRGHMQTLSWNPRVFLLKGFLADEECEHFVKKAKAHMTSSTVVDNETGKSVPSSVRTSTGTFFGKQQDHIIAAVEARVAQVTMLPEDNAEGMQILHYTNGQRYEPHHDFFHDAVNADPATGGQRIGTVLMYLSTPEEGGETIFPDAEGEAMQGEQWSECAKEGGLAVKAKKGDAVFFYSIKPNGETDSNSLHGSCPTLKGDKWSATKWIHVGVFGGSAEKQKAKWGACGNADKHCSDWASMGECQKNAGYMLQFCRLACHVCNVTEAGAHDT